MDNLPFTAVFDRLKRQRRTKGLNRAVSARWAAMQTSSPTKRWAPLHQLGQKFTDLSVRNTLTGYAYATVGKGFINIQNQSIPANRPTNIKGQSGAHQRHRQQIDPAT